VSRKRAMQQTSHLAVTLIAIGIVSSIFLFRNHDAAAGIKVLSGVLVILALLMGFILPVRCKAATIKEKPCRRWAYGVLFRCRDIPGHRFGKFAARFKSKEGSLGPINSTNQGRFYSRSAGDSEPQTISVTVEDSGIGTCTFWFGLISTVAGVAAVALPLIGIH